MLTLLEKFLFIAFLLAATWNGYWAFRKVYEVIRRGQGDVDDENIGQRAWNAFWEWALLKPTWKTRRISSVFHAMVAWGFIFYFLVNFGDILQGLFPITFLGEGAIGNIYRLLADYLSVAVLVGMIYLLVRRFLRKIPSWILETTSN